MEEATDRGKGAGLGLAISKGFVEAMGGRIAAASPIHDGRGTRILISLPKETRRRPSTCCERPQAPHPGHRRRAADPPLPGPGAGCRRLRAGAGRHRRRRPAGDRAQGAGRRGARPRPARHGRQGRRWPRRAPSTRARSSSCPPATARPRRSTRSTSAPTTMWKSRSGSANCWPACAPPCATGCSDDGAEPVVTRWRPDHRPDQAPGRPARGEPIRLSPREYDLLAQLVAGRRQGGHPPPAPDRRLGPGPRAGRPVPARLRGPAPAEDRARSSHAGPDPDRAGGGLPVDGVIDGPALRCGSALAPELRRLR